MDKFPWSTPDQWEQYLQSHFHDINTSENNDGVTLLQLAVQRGYLSLVKLLIRLGVDLETRSRNGDTALLLACQNGSLYITHALVTSGADVMATNNKGCSCIHLAAASGYLHIIHYLVTSKDVSLAVKDNEFNTPLHYAVQQIRTDTVKYILKHEVDCLVMANAKGLTPLHLAVQTGNQALCWRMVYASSANLLTMEDSEGRTPVDLAKHSSLAGQLRTWSGSKRMQLLGAMASYIFHAVIPGLSFFLGMCCYAKLQSPLGLCLTLVLLYGGFLYPMLKFHRIVHAANWPSPSMHGAFVFGISISILFYYIQVLPRVWPNDKLFSVWIVIGSLVMVYMLYLLRTTDPGVNRESKKSIDGRTLTIIDVASGQDGAQFCLQCELVVPEYTKHCFMCEHCVSGFDHHCQWLMKCIGYKNHRLFVIFLYVVCMENLLFVMATISCIIQVHSTYHPIDVIKVTMTDEPWLFILIISNIAAGFIVLMNLAYQLNYISLLNTTYFDKDGNKAYNKQRLSRIVPALEKINNILYFLTDYNKWHQNMTRDKSVSNNFK